MGTPILPAVPEERLPPPRKPTARRRFLWPAVALAVLAAVAGGFLIAYAFLFNGSSARPLTLPPAPTSTGHLAVGSTLGVWSLAPNSVVGYRVREKLAFLPARSDAVGRTSRLAGSITVTRTAGNLTVTSARFLADVRTLKSDRSMRDARIHSIGLQSDLYPTAGFRLTQPIALPPAALRGTIVHFRATGLLTIHGVTRTVSVLMSARVSGTRVETVGSITFPFTEFGMQAPNIGGFVSVENHATLEFDLQFEHGASALNASLLRAIAGARSSPGTAAGPGAPPGGVPGPRNLAFAAYTRCLARHGVTQPSGPVGSAPPGGSGPPPSNGGQPGGASPPGSGPPAAPPGLNSKDPRVAAALKACSPLLPKSRPGPVGAPGATQAP